MDWLSAESEVYGADYFWLSWMYHDRSLHVSVRDIPCMFNVFALDIL